ncbi:MAG: c-type cytochrome [Casimicrobiaceae bacterium]
MSAAEIKLPDGPGANLVYARCQTCHDLQYVRDGKGLLPSQWKSVLASMHDYGLTITPADEAAILTYLTTYLGPNPPPAATAGSAAPASASEGTASAGAGGAPDGRHVFEENCTACHGAEGAGQPGAYPPLAGNPDLKPDPGFPARVVLFGLTGPIEVSGVRYAGTMPSFGHLDDATIAAVVNYVRSAWGNGGAATSTTVLDAAAVAKLRSSAMTSEEVHAYRASFALVH